MKFVKKLLKFLKDYLSLEAPRIPDIDTNDKDRRKKVIKSIDEQIGKTSFWSCAFPCSISFVFYKLIGWWWSVALDSVWVIFCSFVLPICFFRSIKKKPEEGWKIKNVCVLFIFVIWLFTALYAGSIHIWMNTTFMSEDHLRIIIVISICSFANICSTIYAYVKYIRVFKDSVNEKTGTIWSEDEIWAFSSCKAILFEMFLLFGGMTALGIGSIKILPTLLNIVCACWSFICPFLVWESINRDYSGPKATKGHLLWYFLVAFLLSFCNAASMLVMNPVFNIYIIYLQKIQVALCLLFNICSTILLCYKYRKEFVLNKEAEEEVSTSNDVL